MTLKIKCRFIPAMLAFLVLGTSCSNQENFHGVAQPGIIKAPVLKQDSRESQNSQEPKTYEITSTAKQSFTMIQRLSNMTNVFNMPHTIYWSSESSVVQGLAQKTSNDRPFMPLEQKFSPFLESASGGK